MRLATTTATVPTATLRPSTDDFGTRGKIALFRVASYLTDPLCKTHESFRKLSILNELHPTATKIDRLIKQGLLFVELIGNGFVAAFTTLPGSILRALVANLQTDPFLHSHGGVEKTLPKDRTFSMLSWNICCVGAGYAITDGGVSPWSSRIDKIVEKIVEKDADVNCLYETFDTASALYLSEKLKEHGYAHVYFNIGPQAFGVSSGILVASKYKIQNPEFSRFPQDSLIGRTKHAAKGVFSFDLESEGHSFAKIFATHLQHSEEVAFATDEEIAARSKQMQIISEKVKKVINQCVVVTGDLNLDDQEYGASPWRHLFDRGERLFGLNKTWGGDAFCASLVGKRISTALNLDHTMIAQDTAHSLTTSLLETGYEGDQFKEEALSDHAGLFSTIRLK